MYWLVKNLIARLFYFVQVSDVIIVTPDNRELDGDTGESRWMSVLDTLGIRLSVGYRIQRLTESDFEVAIRKDDLTGLLVILVEPAFLGGYVTNLARGALQRDAEVVSIAYASESLMCKQLAMTRFGEMWKLSIARW